jgi:putative IMPACT (imprinted ancient) family translation regulator
VVRFFGGIKLGAGGLVRAYSGTASRVLDETDLVPVAPRSLVRLHLDFGDEPAARRLLARLRIEVQSTDYASGDVLLNALVSEGERAVLVEQLAAVTGGRARIESAMDRL